MSQSPFYGVRWLCFFPLGLMPEKYAADPMIGDCNMTYFVAEGQKCQRMMMSDLKHKTNANCKYV